MKTKKIISALVVMMLILSSLTITAFAEEEILYQPLDDSGNFYKSGSWSTTTSTSLYADDTQTAFTRYSSVPGSTATYYNFDAGVYKVYVWNAILEAAPGRDDQTMEVVVNSVDGASEAYKPRYNNPTEGWVYLDEFTLGSKSSIVFTAGSAAGTTDPDSNNVITSRVGSVKLIKTADYVEPKTEIIAYPAMGEYNGTANRIIANDATADGNGIFAVSGIGSGARAAAFKNTVTDYDIGRPLSGYTGYTNLWPDRTLAANSDNMAQGVLYKPAVSAEAGTAGWYEVYLERLVYDQNDPDRNIDTSILHVEVRHAGGRSQYVMNTTLEDAATQSADLVYVGTFYFDGKDDSVSILCPVMRNLGDDAGKRLRFDFAGAKFVKTDGPAEAKGYYKPVYGDTLADGINTTWYETTGTAAFDFASANVKIPAGSSLKVKYDANDDAKDAVAFTEGAIRFDMVWRNTTQNDASASVVIGKSASSTAEFKIYSEKLEYWENGSYVKEIPIFAYYAHDYEAKKDGTYNTWHPNTLCGENVNVHTMRLEISAPELLTADISQTDGNIVSNEKTVKLIINDGKSVARVMAMGTLPANSILNSADADLTDNYIEFKNNAGATDSADISIANIGVMVPDDTLTSDNIYATSYNEFKYTDFKDEFDVDAGVLTMETDLVRPAEITNTLLNSNEKPVMAILAPYAASGKLSDAPTVYTLGVLPGTKKTIRLVVDSKPYLDTTVKLFIWDSFDSLVPAQEMQRAYVD